MELARHTIGNVYLASGLSRGTEVFLGRALETVGSDRLLLEGKAANLAPGGAVQMRPFATSIVVAASGDEALLQQLVAPGAIAEASQLLASPVIVLESSSFPFLEAWIRSTLGAVSGDAPAPRATVDDAVLLGPWRTLRGAVERFRGVLLESPALRDTHSLDRLAELEGELVIELGRTVARLAVRLRECIARHAELLGELAQLPDEGPGAPDDARFGWLRLRMRTERARAWARRAGRTSLARELGAFQGDARAQVQAILSRYEATLDALVTETFAATGLPIGMAGIFSGLAAAPRSAAVQPREELPRAPTEPVPALR